MVQFYFLAIFVNLIGGFYFANELFANKFPAVTKIKEFLDNGKTGFVFAIVAGITGLFKIISVFYDDVPVLGDLFIAVSSLVICLYFLHDKLIKKEESSVIEAETVAEGAGEQPEVIVIKKEKEDFSEKLNKFYSFTEKFKGMIGIGAIILAVLHFCFPAVIFI